MVVEFLDGPMVDRILNLPDSLLKDMKVMIYTQKPYLKCIYTIEEKDGKYIAKFSHDSKE